MPRADTPTVVHHDDPRTTHTDVTYQLHRDEISGTERDAAGRLRSWPVRPALQPHLRETLQAIADGCRDTEVADRLKITVATAKTRLRTLYAQLGARDRAHAVAIGAQLGVLQLPHLPLPDWVLADQVPLTELAAAREHQGLSQQRMAATLGVSRAWLCARETGKRPFPMRVVLRYAQIVGVDLYTDAPSTGPAGGERNA
jgi:DNA-binding CsgD family transcriptional regulator/DNA-binding XRE family transcriptional regulator